MRIRLIFLLKSKGAALPFHHQGILYQTFGQLLRELDMDRDPSAPFFNFSGVKGQTRVSRKGLHYLSSRVTIVISNPEGSFVEKLTDYILEQERVEVGDLQLQPESADVEDMPDFDDETKFVCISPMVIVHPSRENGMAKRFISPEEDIFSDYLYESTLLRMKEFGAYSTAQLKSFYKFQLVPDKNYLEKIRTNNKKFARIYHLNGEFEDIEIRGYTFPFTLFADAEVQRFLFLCGMGYFTHSGFGMIDLAHPITQKKTKSWKSVHAE